MLLKVVVRFRYSFLLLKQLVITDFKLRYQGSVLGYLWSLLKPLALFLILYFVFTNFIKIGAKVPHYSVYLLLGIVLWSYFVEVTSTGISAIVSKGDIIRKINFPKYVIILAVSLSALINLSINLVVVLIFSVINGVDFKPIVLVMPLLVVEMFVFSTALALILSAAFVRFRDLSHIWDVVLQGAFYATPIIYPLTEIAPRYAKLLLLNPIAQIIQDARFALVTQTQPTINSLYNGNQIARLIPVLMCFFLAAAGILVFKRRSKYFAEEV